MNLESNNNLKVSVAMCTYNGERFVREQLESIACQLLLPDEVVICDDVSTDSTKAILEDFAKSAPFPVRLVFNHENLGYVKNFEKAISLCEGDIVYLSDQDDIWREDKIEKMQAAFERSGAGMIFTNACIADEQGQPTGSLLWEKCHFNDVFRQRFLQGEAYKILYLKNIVSGCTMAFNKKLWPYITPLPENIPFIHDAWIALMTAIFDEVTFVDEPLIKYRLHPQQSAALERQKIPVNELVTQVRQNAKNSHYQRNLEQIKIIRERINNTSADIENKKRMDLLHRIDEHEKHLSFRVVASSNTLLRVVQVMRELLTGRYHSFSNGFKSAFADTLKRVR